MSRSRSRSALGATLVLAIAFAAAILALLGGRLATGDAHPPYSSFRVDPLGARALFDAIDALPERTSERALVPPERLVALLSERPEATTVLLLGIDPIADWGETHPLARRLASLGSRVVISFAGDGWAGARVGDDDPELAEPLVFERTGSESDDEATVPGDGGTEPAEVEPPETESAQVEPTEIEPNVTEPDVIEPDPIEPDAIEPEEIDPPPGRSFDRGTAELLSDRSGRTIELPEELPWRSAWFASDPPEAWRAIYGTADGPVVLERTFGRGEVVVLTGTYLVSNEGLAKDRQAALLSWVLGEHRVVLFDEYHLGTQSASGVLALVARYRLGGFFVGLSVLALLFAWRASCSIVPPSRHSAESVTAMGRRSSDALATMLSRGLRGDRLLEACVDAWRLGPGQRATSRTAETMRELAAASDEPVSGYETLRRHAETQRNTHLAPGESGEGER